MYELSTEYWFDSAHFLTDYNGKCENLHGHQWRVTAYVRASELGAVRQPRRTWSLTLPPSSASCARSATRSTTPSWWRRARLPPATMDALAAEGFSLTVLPFRTTSENLARYLFERLAARGLPVSRVDCNETPNNRASFSPDRG